MRVVVLALAFVMGAGCASMPAAPTGPVDTELVLAPGEVKEASGAGINIRFQGVFGDSRCPADVVCIQGGDALVRIDVLPQGGGSTTYDLHTGNMQPVHHADLMIALVTLVPYPFSGRTIAPGDYRATLHVTR